VWAAVLGLFLDEGVDPARAEITRFADLRYRGQSSELTVPMPAGQLDDAAMRAIEESFESEFERTYGHRGDTKAFEFVTARLVLRVARQVEHGEAWAAERQARTESERPIYFGAEQGLVKAAVLSRSRLGREPRPGPALIQEYDTTIVVPPGCSVGLDDHGNVVIDTGA
jgi:N-methylhydantoinase A